MTTRQIENHITTLRQCTSSVRAVVSDVKFYEDEIARDDLMDIREWAQEAEEAMREMQSLLKKNPMS